jgi:hypothetical protein
MVNFFWDDQGDKHRYHLSNWYSLAQKKEHGGLGFPNLRDLNLCLLASWFQRFYDPSSKLWKDIVRSSTRLTLPICSAVMIGRGPLLERGDVGSKGC